MAQAAPKPKLEIWSGQRVLLVLPLTIGPDWNGGAELAEALKPIMRPVLQRELIDTDKFSVTLPYRFDPILRRAVVENRIADDIMTPFLSTPSLETAQPVFNQLKFEQVPMVTQIQLEELRVGGTPKKPTLQLQASGKLYEVGGSGPFRTVVVTSNPAEGKNARRSSAKRRRRRLCADRRLLCAAARNLPVARFARCCRRTGHAQKRQNGRD